MLDDDDSSAWVPVVGLCWSNITWKAELKKKSEIKTSTVTGIIRLLELKALQNICIFHKVNFVMIQECKMLPT